MANSIIEEQLAGMYNLGCSPVTIKSAVNDFRQILRSQPEELALLDDLEVRYVKSFEIREGDEELESNSDSEKQLGIRNT
ncbi:hypothetical protein [Saccharibacillus brassicae]|uniref:Uncharacterized protein n=1 Tax=Saccharibacillus brassicae TaxID=2583377 RepID=A0A4Y6V0E5_SACBS|nr:hypothetical protein [Saccharibacillus brassicae]QDH23499.1 hypothetical protein FFV09_23115 [Saccharibacillus brassicae]